MHYSVLGFLCPVNCKQWRRHQMPAWNCATIATGTCFPAQSVTFSPLLLPVHTKHLWIWWELKQKALRHKVILQCCTRPREQDDRCTPKRRRHCIFSVAAHIIFVFNSLVIHWPPHPPHWIYFPQSLLNPSPHSSLPSFPPPSLFPSSLPSAGSMWLSAWSPNWAIKGNINIEKCKQEQSCQLQPATKKSTATNCCNQ